MKSKVLTLLTIIALVGILVAFNSSQVWAQQEEPTETRRPGKVQVEFSDVVDDSAVTGGGNIALPDPEQVLFTHALDVAGPPYPRDGFDYGGSGEVDALANNGDAYYLAVVGNIVSLLVSFQGDPLAPDAVWNEPPAPPVPPRAPHWTQVNLNNPNAAAPGKLDDLDGLELWGPRYGDDANCYSLAGDPGGFSVYNMNTGGYVPTADIVAAVTALGGPAVVDLDALMVWDAGGGFDGVWNDGDEILFSIRASAPWHGGEIVRLPFTGKPGSATFLSHGGHLWDSTVPNKPSVLFGVPTDEVDAIEATFWYPEEGPDVPTLTEWGLIVFVGLFILTLIFVLRRRRRVPTPA